MYGQMVEERKNNGRDQQLTPRYEWGFIQYLLPPFRFIRCILNTRFFQELDAILAINEELGERK